MLTLYGADEIDLNELLKGEKIISPSASYEIGKAEFNPQFAAFLDKLGAFLKENPGLVIEIGGHTDNSGSPALNQKLSETRAQRVKDYLVRKSKITEER
ncbi:MAG: OmpA family protein, partial [Candidatus Aminicenantes bacterium]|nr:OmpA family protein [Candidatus Aminicenantes bacterium]